MASLYYFAVKRAHLEDGKRVEEVTQRAHSCIVISKFKARSEDHQLKRELLKSKIPW